MPREPEISFSEQAARTLLACPRPVRERLLRTIGQLRSICHHPADITVKDASGRGLSISYMSQWAITWWLHPVDWELRVLRIEKIIP